MINILARALLMSTPLLIGATAEVMAERAGVMIIAIEGIFLIGAWGGFVGVFTTGSYLAGFGLAAALGFLIALVYGCMTIILKQHQIVTGTALTIFVAGLVTFLHRVLFGVPLLPLTIEPLRKLAIPFLSDIPVVGSLLFGQSILTYLAFALAVIAFFILSRTSAGLVVRSTGENPVAVDVVGISVEKVRMTVVLIAGVLGGIAGSFYSIALPRHVHRGNNRRSRLDRIRHLLPGKLESARGHCGSPHFRYRGISGNFDAVFGGSFLPNELFIALPYILTIILTVSRRHFNVPAQLGVPYRKEN